MSEHYISVRGEEGLTTITNPNPGFNSSHRSSFTIHAAKSGSSYGNSTTETGHVFLEINTPSYRGSIGFSPGERTDTSRDNISTMDHLLYTETSSHRFEVPNTPRFQSMMDNLSAQANGYANGSVDPGDYNLVFNNCIHFVERVLSKAGVSMELSATPNGVAKTIKKCPEPFTTPLLIDLSGEGITTLPIEYGVKFDFKGESDPIHTGWAGKNTGFLVMDRNNDGLINDGRELFGDNTPLPNGGTASDGAIALTALDGNQDRRIDRNDTVWEHLKIWQDINSNGASEHNELKSLIDIGLKSISLSFAKNSSLDQSGNIHELSSTVEWHNGRVTDITDVLFRTSDSRPNDDAGAFIFQDSSVELVGSRYSADEVWS